MNIADVRRILAGMGMGDVEQQDELADDDGQLPYVRVVKILSEQELQ